MNFASLFDRFNSIIGFDWMCYRVANDMCGWLTAISQWSTFQMIGALAFAIPVAFFIVTKLVDIAGDLLGD